MLDELYDLTGEVKSNLLEYVPCNLCGSESYEFWGSKYGFPIVKCKKCSLIFVNPRLNAEGRHLAYSSNYFELQESYEDRIKRQNMYKIEITDMERTISGGMILDVGAGGGAFLMALGPHWEKYGCEFNEVAAVHAREKYNLAVTTGELREIKYPSDFFDCVSIRGVIEHLPDPLGDLREVYRILKTNGIVSINTPNIDSLCGRLYRENFRLVDPRFHIYYFDRQTIGLMLQKAGFKILREMYFYLDTPYANPIDDIIKIVSDLARKQIDPQYSSESPPFFENVINIYAYKE